jgi:nucleoside-diphosphate kinase
MAIERTLSIIKPDATRRNLTGAVNATIEQAGLRIVAQKRVLMTRAQAETFYGVHKERPFFGELVDQMTAGPVVVQVLEAEDAIARYPYNAVVAGIATFEGKRDAGTLPPDAGPRYLLGIVRHISERDEGLAIAEHLWRLRRATHDAALTRLDTARRAVVV